MESQYLEGKARVPLSNLRSESLDFEPLPINIIEHLGDPGHVISVRITSETRDCILRDLNYSPKQLYATLETGATPLVNDQTFFYGVRDSDLDSATAVLGRDHVCNVHLYCIPAQPRKMCDGTVFRNVRYYMAESWEKNRVSVAQAWMDKLSGPKRKILASLLKHSDILVAMDSMLCFPGYWDGLQLGNWAKHLAARIDPLIINYWDHIKNVAMKIMAGHEDKLHLLDENTVTSLQYRAPSWNSEDKAQICHLFDSGIVFPGIQSKSVRDRIKNNILQLSVLIPSVQTFHENMKYLTIGAKILEKYIENRPLESRTETIKSTSSGLVENLKKDWDSHGALMEVGHDRMVQVVQPTADNAVIQAFIAALRYFPHLSPEAPLRDFDKRVWMAGNLDNHVLSRLCAILTKLGFSNANIKKGSLHPIKDSTSRHIPYARPLKRRDWRSGKPCLAGYHILLEQSFYPRLFPETFGNEVPPELRVQSDILQSFFGGKPKVPSAARLHTEIDVDMTGTNETLKLRPFNVTGAKKKQRGHMQLKRRQRRAIARSAGSKKPSVRRKGPKFSQQHVPDIPATRTSDLEIGSPVDILSRGGERLTPPPKHPSRPQGSKRKHSEVIDGAVEEPEGKKKRQRQDEVEQGMMDMDMSLVMSDMDRIVQPVEALEDLADLSVLPVEPVPAENVQNSLGDGAGYDPHQIPDILSDDGFSPPSIDVEEILELHLPY